MSNIKEEEPYAKKSKNTFSLYSSYNPYIITQNNNGFINTDDIIEIKDSILQINENISYLISINSNLTDTIQTLQNENILLKNYITSLESKINIMNNNINTLQHQGIDLPNLQKNN